MIKYKTLPLLLLISLSGCATYFMPEKYEYTSKEKFNSKINIEANKKEIDLINWWSQFNDPTLVEVIKKAQENNSDIAEAAINLANAQLSVVNARAKTLPTLNAVGNASKGITMPGFMSTPMTTYQAGFQTSWELDILGKNSLLAKASQLQYEGAKSKWHDARTIVASQTAKSYFTYQYCQISKKVLTEDYKARKTQLNITKNRVEAGFEAMSSQFTSEATLKEAEKSLVTTENNCEAEIKGLVALTGINEEDLTKKISNYDNEYIKKLLNKKELGLYFPITVPGELLTQRPDILSMKNQLEATAMEIGARHADRYPSISISGNIYKTITRSEMMNTQGTTWSIGPISVTLPIFDGGMRKASEQFSREKYEQQKIQFASTVRTAVKEVEVALNNLDATQQKLKLNQDIVAGYKKSYQAALERYKSGFSGLFELEDARRTYLTAINNEVTNHQDRLNAWIDLYKALGGGFQNEDKNEKK